jgi:hypothetical protein
MLLFDPNCWRGRGIARCVAFILLATSCGVSGQAPVVPKPDRAPEFRLSGDRVVLPIVMVRDYPFVEGQVEGVKGKLMLDTGLDQALSLNDHRISLPGGKTIGTGQFGSGQTFAIRLNAAVENVQTGSLHFARVTHVQSQDATQLEHITPDFIGWIGYYFWQGYALKLDYKRSQTSFYRGSPKAYLAGEKVLAIIPFEVGKLPNHPLVHIRIGGIDATAAFDTGQYGAIFTDEASKARLLTTGVLKAGRDDGSYDLDSIDLGDHHLPGVKGVEVSTDPFPPASAIGTTTRTVVTIGYGFLRQYKTVWDYREKRIYLLAR